MQWRKIFPTPVISREYCHCSEDKPPAGIKKKKRVQLLGDGEMLVHKCCKNNVSFEVHFNVRVEDLSSQHTLK